MLRLLLSAVKNVQCLRSLTSDAPVSSLHQFPASTGLIQHITRSYRCSNTAQRTFTSPLSLNGLSYLGLLQPKPHFTETIRTNIKFSKTKGKRKTVHIVLRKFFRLNWGCWIHARCGRHKRLYKKTAARRRRLQYFVFCNGKQSLLLDKMVTRYWRKPRHYVDDPYQPYHTREEFPYTRMKPFQPFL